MFENVTSDVHEKRSSRNFGTAICLGAFIVLLFALTAVKVQQLGGPQEGFDHVVRPQMLPVEGE
ncbi:MAG: hypothetical protein AAF714_00540 [Pseudomonadota bacterium]